MGTRLWKAYVIAQLAAIGLYAFAPADTVLAMLWQVAVGWTGSIAVFVGIKLLRPPGRAAWACFGVGIFANATGILAQGILTRVYHVTTSPTLADCFWLALFPGLGTGLAIIIRQRTPGRDWSTLVDSTIITTSFALLSWVFLIRPATANPDATLIVRLTVAAYPIGDLVVLGLLIRLLLGGGTRNATFRALLGAVLCFLGADLGWALITKFGQGAPHALMRSLEMGSLSAFALVGAAALHPSVRDVAVRVPPRPAGLSRIMLMGLTLASLAAPAVLAFEASRHKVEDGLAIAGSSAVLFVLVVVRMVQLLTRLAERTNELAERNAATRLVLDTVTEGLLRISNQGTLGQERSAMIDRWFGPFGEATRFSDYIRPFDADFATRFQFAHEALVECALTPEIHLSQMPTRLRGGGREYRVSYLPIADGSAQNGGLLMVISDETDRLSLTQHESEQAELLSLFQRLTRDRVGLVSFMSEANALVERALDGEHDLATQRRLVHTLKGNAAMTGLKLVTRMCHEAEEEMLELGLKHPPKLVALGERWAALQAAFTELVGQASVDVVEVPISVLDELGEGLARGYPTRSLLRQVSALRCEPVDKAFARLATHARTLAQKLNKGEPEIEITGGGLALDPQRWRPLWSEMTHVINNAVDHGFEAPTERRAAKKSAQPHLRLQATVEDTTFVLTVADDGRGIDWDRLRAVSRARGLPADSHEDLTAALFAAGVSTRSEATEISGRGIGLAAVLSRVHAFGGEITVTSEPGVGTTWRLVFPRTALDASEESLLAQPIAAPKFDVAS